MACRQTYNAKLYFVSKVTKLGIYLVCEGNIFLRGLCGADAVHTFFLKVYLVSYSVGGDGVIVFYAPFNMVGGFLSLELVMEDGACRIENTVFHPTVFYYNTGFFGQKILFQQDYTEALAVSHGVQTYAEAYNKTAAELLSYTRGIIGAEFLAPEVRS